MSDRLDTAAEAADFLRWPLNTLYIKCREGAVPHYRVGAQLRFDRDELRAWVAQGRRGPKVGAA